MRSKFILIVFFIGIFILFVHPFDGNADFYHHVNTGKYILDHKSLPNLDEFSHTAKGLPWVAHSWSSGLIFYLILHFFGEIGISLFIAFLATLTFILLYKLLRSYQISQKITFLALLVAATPISSRFPQRPESLGYFLTTLYLLIDKLGEKYKFLCLLFPLTTLIWGNFYGSGAILGLGLIGLFTLKQFAADKFRIIPSKKMFYISTLLCLPLSFFNGYGLKSLLYFYYYIPKVAQYEGEWAGIIKILNDFPISFLINYQYQILIYLIYLALFLTVIILSWKKIIRHKFLLIIGLSIFIPFFALRQLPTTIILSLPIFAKILSEQSGLKRIVFLALSILVGIFILGIGIWTNTPTLTSEVNISQQSFIKFTKDHNLSGRAFNHSSMGSFLTYTFYPKILIFYDTRDELYLETDALKDLYQLFSQGTSILPILAKYKIDLVLGDLVADGISYKELFYSKEWAVVFFDDKYFVAIPRKIAQDKQIQALDFLDPYSPTGIKPGFEQKGIQYLSSLNSKSFNNQILYVNSLIFFNRYPEAINILKTLSSGKGPSAVMFTKDRDYLLALSYIKMEDCTQAKFYLEKVEKEIKGIFIFDPNKILPTQIYKGYAFYYLVCNQNLELAHKYLNLYLKDVSVSPVERLKAQLEFDKYRGH